MKKKLFIVLSTIILTLSACGSDSKEKTGVDSGFENGNQTNENANNNQNTQKEITFTISYELDGGVNASANPSSYVVGSTLSFETIICSQWRFMVITNQPTNQPINEFLPGLSS